MTDLVIQSPDLSADAIEAFQVGCPATGALRRAGRARLTGVADDAETRRVAAALSSYWRCDAAFVAPDLKLADFALLALDMDSTLVSLETLDAVAAYVGKGAEVAAITAAAMRGEIADYPESLRRRVALLAGADAALLARVYDEKLQLSPGAEVLLSACKAAGLRTLLVTGGPRYFADRLQERLGFDFVRANEVQVVDDRLTGKVSGPAQNDGAIVDAAGKARALRDVCSALGCSPQRAIAIGDGANDLAMLKLAGLSVAFRAKPVVQRAANQVLNYAGLDGVLAWFSDAGR